jgi:hypothetical protein
MAVMAKSRQRTPPKRKRVGRQVPTIADYVAQLPKDRLVEIVLDQVGENALLERELQDEILERFGGTSDVVEDARQVLESTISAELEFDRGGYSTPVDYGPVQSAFQRLLKEKQYEVVLELGPILAKGSQYHIETTSSDFEPHYSVSECIGCVVRALAEVDWPKADKIVYAVRLVIEDDYCACEKAEELLKRRWARRDWKTAADMLRKLASEYPQGKSPRRGLDRWIATAEENGE